MHQITYQGKSWRCSDGANLRREIIDQGLSPYNGKARYVNCRGLGTCGTCAVEIEGAVTPMTPVERWRLGFPPHRPGNNLRLACQCNVQGDVVVKKNPGFWGHL